MALACLRLDMYRQARMVPLMMLAVLMLHPPPASSPSVDRTALRPMAVPISPAESAGPSVRIEHELVRLPKPRPRMTRPAQWRSTRLAAAEPVDHRPPLLVRARRAFVGNGRYKPEPFPRVETK